MACEKVKRAAAHEKWPVYTFTFDPFAEDVMPVGGYIAPFGGYELNGETYASTVTDEIYKEVKECGINFFAAMKQDYNVNREETERSLALAEKYGIMLFIKDSYLFTLNLKEKQPPLEKEKFAARVKAYQDHPAFAGLVGRDEPFGHELPAVEAVQQRFNEVFAGTKKGLYMNSHGYQCPQPWLSGGPEYVLKEDWSVPYFMDRYLHATRGSQFFSYDTYPFCYEDGRVRERYIENLQLVRDKMMDAKKPFWSFVQSGGYYDEDPNWFVPTKGGLTWNVTTSLAYGAKGIQYFPYAHPSEFEKPESGIPSLIGRRGEKTDRWYYAKEINAHIKAVQHILMHSCQVCVVANGDSPCPIPKTETAFRELIALSGDDSLVGCFDHNGKTVLYVVNNSVDKSAEITLEFDDCYAYDVIQGVTATEMTGKRITLQFAPGEGALVALR
ncbi:MAG: hypothetical protein IJX87_03195 [Clostridia bacterium]|nr:hypothetical protein [Clostridia bacterium]